MREEGSEDAGEAENPNPMTNSHFKAVVLLFLLTSFPMMGWSKIELPALFSDHIVLQRQLPIPIWGKASPGSSISVFLDNLVAEGISDADGNWMVTLPEMEAGGPFRLVVRGEDEKKVIEDVLIGEVWLCSGQSNMQFPLERSATGEEELKRVNASQIRLFSMTGGHSLGPRAFSPEDMDQMKKGDFLVNTPWELCQTKSAAKFSAVAYYFGKLLADSLEVPIGLIHNAVGGSPIQAWMKKESLLGHPQLAHLAGKEWLEAPEHHPWVISRVKENLGPWLSRGKEESVMWHPFSPEYLFESGIRPLAPFAMRGVIWYQGESNATHPQSYRSLFEIMIKDWRKAWDRPKLPFLFVQLPRISNRSRWPEFRQQQQKCLEIDHTGMVVAIDKGHPTDVHPRGKKAIGHRLGSLALVKIHQHDFLAESPVLTTYNWQVDQQRIELSFKNVGTGFLLSSGAKVTGFSLQGYHKGGGEQTTINPTQIILEDSVIILSYPNDFLITDVSYAWAPFPQNNLTNSLGLPLAPFRIELAGNN